MPVIEVRDLKRDYITKKGIIRRKREIVHAVDGITFSVEAGEIFGLLGQNGAGKTTTIKMLITMLAPTSGVCKVLGFDTFGQEKQIRSRINFIFGGELGVYRRLSGRDNLRYFANLHRIPLREREQKVDELLELVGLTDKADLLSETYSKGMIQRLQIARGLLNDPEVLFMDEPTIGLDPLGADMLRSLIVQLKQQGRTILLTTHNMYEADKLCDRIAIIHRGKILCLDTPERIKSAVGDHTGLLVRLRAVSEQQLSYLAALGAIATQEETEQEAYVQLRIVYENQAGMRENIIAILVKSELLYLKEESVSLEDAYIRIVKGAGG